MIDSSNVDVAPQGFETDGADVQQLILDEENSELQKQLSVFVDSTTVGRMETAHGCASNLETIFSPFLESIQINNQPNIDNNAGDFLFELIKYFIVHEFISHSPLHQAIYLYELCCLEVLCI